MCKLHDYCTVCELSNLKFLLFFTHFSYFDEIETKTTLDNKAVIIIPTANWLSHSKQKFCSYILPHVLLPPLVP